MDQLILKNLIIAIEAREAVATIGDKSDCNWSTECTTWWFIDATIFNCLSIGCNFYVIITTRGTVLHLERSCPSKANTLEEKRYF